MVRKSKGYRSSTRALLRKKPRQRGKIGLSRLLQPYKIGDKVVIKIEPSLHKGMPYKRFHGMVGTIKQKRGRSYIVSVMSGSKEKQVITRPEHLKPFEG
ncbi:MAG: 50S ribosomal protein L21e [Candidatus Bathyarchaeia archaeon]